jgi:hypothetical protein
MTNHKVLSVLLLFAFSWILFCVSTVILVEPSLLIKGFIVVLCLMTLWRPAWGIGLFLVTMPLYGGSKPGDFHTIHFIEILTFLDLSLSLRLLIHVCKNNKIISVRLQNPLVFVIFVYWLIALLSLSTVCPSSQIRALIWPEPLEAYSFIGLTEEAYMYSWHSWFILTESLLLGIALYNIPTSNKNWSMRWVYCLLAGLVASLVLGVLDFYSLIDLTAVRPAFHLKDYGPAYRHQRLSSVFGNPGWYAQFVTLATPAVLAILSIPLRRRSLLFVMIGLMALTEFTLILAYQRGGWISYPLTLLVVWFCIYVFDAEHQSTAEIRAKTKSAIKKILISVPVTIIISVSLIYIIGKNTTTEYNKVDTYLERAKGMQNTQDRLAYWVPTSAITKLNPILGAGNESYSFQFTGLYLGKDAPYALTEKENMIMAGSAHNLYFQTLAGKGWLGLVSLLALMLVSIRISWTLTFSQGKSPALIPLSNNQRLLVMMGFTYTMALMIYSNVGEIFYVPINYIVFVLFYALIIRDVPQIRNIASKTTIKILLGIAFFFILHLLWEYGYPSAIRDKLKQSNPSGCYAIEGNPIDPATQYRWCSRQFTVNAPLTMIDSKPYAMIWLAPQLPAHSFPFQVKVLHKGKQLIEQTLTRGGAQRILAALPMEALNLKSGFPINDHVSLEVITNDSFIPLLETNGAASDIRNLSVQWFFNEAYPGCYENEGNPLEPASQFRWCSSHFQVRLPVIRRDSKQYGSLSLLAAPQLVDHHNAFTLQVLLNGKMVQSKTLTPGSLEQVMIELPFNHANPSIIDGGSDTVLLDFVTSDAFIPFVESKGVSADTRILSVQWFYNN